MFNKEERESKSWAGKSKRGANSLNLPGRFVRNEMLRVGGWARGRKGGKNDKIEGKGRERGRKGKEGETLYLWKTYK